jgi:hypothetical protein
VDSGGLRATLYVCSAAELPSSCIRKRSAVSLPEKAAKTVAAELPDAYEEIWRNGKIFMGLRVDLSKVSARHVHELIETSWRHGAPTHLVVAYNKRIRKIISGH